MAEKSDYVTIDAARPSGRWAAITPGTTELEITRGLYVSVAGDLDLISAHGDAVLFSAAANGYHPLQVQKVLATRTTATGIVALY